MSEYEVIPQEAIDSLLANPEKAGGFDTVFGQGRAAEVLASRDPQPDPQPEVDEDLSLIGKLWDATGRAALYGVQEAVSETIDSAESLYEWGNRVVGGKLNELGIPTHLDLWDDEEGRLQFKFMTYEESIGQPGLFGQEGVKGDAIDITVLDAPKTVVGGLVGGVTQFVAGYFAAGKFTKLAGLRGAFVNGAIADAFVFDPNDQNLTGLAEEFGLTGWLEEFGVNTGPLVEFLATNPDDPEYINRLRNAGEGVIAGALVEALGWAVRGAKALKAGDTAGAQAAQKQAEKALKPIDEALKAQGGAVVTDAQQSLDMAKELFGADLKATADDITAPRTAPDGQLNLDLGDTPTAARADPTKASPDRIYLTPEKVERIRYQSTLARGQPLSTRLANLSFRSPTTMSSWDEVADELAGMSSVLADEFTAIKGGDVQRWKTVQAQSGAAMRRLLENSRDPEALIKEFQTTFAGKPSRMAAELLARENMVRTLADNATKMAKVIVEQAFDAKAWPGIRDMDHLKLAYRQNLELIANLAAGNNANRSNIARTMRAMNIARKNSKAVENILKDPSAFRDIDAIARAMADPANAGKSPVKVMDDTMAKIHGYLDRVNTYRINALLSGPGTQEVNLISNMINSVVIPSEQALGAASKGDVRLLRHAMNQFVGSFLGTIDSGRTAIQAGWWDEAILDPFSQKIEGSELIGKVTGIDPIDKVVRLPSRALMTMDEFFKQAQYRGRIYADAHMLANDQNLKGIDRENFIKKYLVESFEDGAGIREDALLQSRRSTFTEPLEPGLAQAIQQQAIKHPTIRFIIPFVRTPVNILSQTFQHMPAAGMLSRRFRADLAAGGARAAQARGRQIVGTALTAAAGWMAATGQITGSGPSDPRLRSVWLKNNQPYAFKIPQEDGSVRWVSYSRLEPLSNIFAIAADLVEISNDEFNESDTRMLYQALFMAVMENTVNKTFTQGIYDAMQALVGRPHEQERAVRNMVGSFVPNIMNQLNGDETLRETRSVLDAIKARTGLYNEVDPKRNVLGEPIVRTLPKYDPLGITNQDIREIDPVLEEVTRAAIITQTVADNPSQRVPGPNNIDLTKEPYSDTQSIYDRWLELTGTVVVGGKTLRERLEETINSTAYKRAPDGDVGVDIKTKGSILRKIISQYREAAKLQFPELRKIIQDERKGTAALLQSQAATNRELFPAQGAPTSTRSMRRNSFEELLNAP